MTSEAEARQIAYAWRAVRSGESSEPDSDVDRVDVTGMSSGLNSRFQVREIALASVTSALMAADALHRRRGGRQPGAVAVDRGHVAAAVRSQRYFRRGGQSSGVGFAPLSRFWPAADGWVRTHANYPWHRAALLAALGVTGDGEGAGKAVAAAIAALRAEEVEDRAF